jgi:hypothetical protein
VRGYPAFDAEFVEYLMNKHRIPSRVYDRTWLETGDYHQFGLVVVVGDLVRAGTTPNQYSESDLERVQTFLNHGGTLLLMRTGQRVFNSQQGRTVFSQLVGGGRIRSPLDLEIVQADHPWLRHLDPKLEHDWVSTRNVMPLPQSKGECLVGAKDGGYASLLRVPIGKGQLVYLGWEISSFLPNGRGASTVDAERLFEEQIRLVENILTEVCSAANARDLHN